MTLLNNIHSLVNDGSTTKQERKNSTYATYSFTNPINSYRLKINCVLVRNGTRSKQKNIINIDMRSINCVPTEVECEKYHSTDFFKENSDVLSLQSREYEKIRQYCKAALEARRREQAQQGRGREIEGDILITECAKPIHRVCDWIGHIEGIDELHPLEAQSLLQAVFRLEEILKARGLDSASLHKLKSEFTMANDKIAKKIHEKWQVSGKTKDNQLKAGVFNSLTAEEHDFIDEMSQYNSDKLVADSERSPSRKKLDESIKKEK
ncbi:hypothetical protein [Vibrio mediterranei]|uniref:hypothetical protein n=1 Tax=Vibrio mediterranei TaxID=689 RepID=UPI0002D80971|nr:hypothetical protein [Vibrio mediterranei]